MAMRMSDTDDDAIVAEINITPLTDVALVLLIIFMISSSAMLESGLQVKLPSAKANAIAQNSNTKPTTITLSKDGTLQINEKQIPPEQLAATLKEQLSQSADKTVVIRGDESIVLGKAVEIMDTARAAGAEKIAVATQPK